jgi:hypothetical protein
MPLTWETIVAHALRLPGAEPGSHYGTPTVKANGRALIGIGREAGSFVLHVDPATKLLLIETDPGTYWESPHYRGWPSVLVRYDSAAPDRVLEMVDKAYQIAMASKPPRSRKAKARA